MDAMVETASQVAAREALKGKREELHKPQLENNTQPEANGQSLRRAGARRGRYRQRRKRKDGCLVKDASTVDGSMSMKIMCTLNYETCKRMVEPPESQKAGSGCHPSHTKHYQHRQEPQSPRAAIEIFRDLAIAGNRTDRKWLQGKNIDLIQRGQSGWAGAGFDRSPSPSSLPMPPSELLERACQTDLSGASF